MVEIYYSPHFIKMYKKLPKQVKLAAEEKEKIFRQDPFGPRLKTHKLTGKLKDY
jgi:mRNA-degrading endonuclease YafQ of YafQ-DinJ toxin-antitoxin module